MNTELNKETTPNVEDQPKDTVVDKSTFEEGVEPVTDQTSSDDKTVDDKTSTETTETPNAEETKTAEAAKDDEPSKQDKIDHAFAKKQKELRATEERARIAEQKAAEAEAKLAEVTKVKRPDIPELPDPYDPDYEAKIANRDNAIKAQQKWDNDEVRAQEIAQDKQQQSVKARLDDLVVVQGNFRERAGKLGIDIKDLDATEKAIAPFMTPQNAPTVEHILRHKQGPLILSYLDSNPDVLSEIANMQPVDASVKIATDIVPNLGEVQKKTTSAPKPVETFDSKAPSEKEHPALKGVVYE